MKTEGLCYLGERKIELRELEIPEPASNEVAVEMELCGICGWDVLSYAGRFGKFHPYPYFAGHEGIGRVTKTGERVTSVKVGQRVACHEVPIDTPGGPLLARHAIRTDQKVSAIPETSIPLKYWVVEPVVCIVNGLVYSGIQPGDSVAIVGAGYMGLIFMQGLSHMLAGEVVVFDVNEQRLALAKGMGASEVYKVEAGKPLGKHAKAFDVINETGGTPDSLRMALALAKPAATIQNFAWNHHELQFDLDEWHVNAWRILNIHPGSNPHFGDLFPRTIKLMAKGLFSNEKLVTHTASFDKPKDLFDIALDRKDGYMKGVLLF